MASRIGVGFIRSSTSSARFLGNFTSNNQSYIIAGSFSSSVPPFKSSTATIKFEDPEKDLSGTKPLDGIVGSDKIRLNIGNGTTIEGKLDVPIHPASSVVGAAFLTQS